MASTRISQAWSTMRSLCLVAMRPPAACPSSRRRDEAVFPRPPTPKRQQAAALQSGGCAAAHLERRSFGVRRLDAALGWEGLGGNSPQHLCEKLPGNHLELE